MQWSISMRPHTFNEMYGCDGVKKYFYNIAKTKVSYPSAVLLEGIFGGGKTTAAKIIAQMISCEHPKENGDPCCECPSCKAIMDETFDRDCIQIDGGQTGKDEIIDVVTNFVSRPAYRGNHQKVLIMEEIQELSSKAKNALLKLLEKPKDNVHFIFTSMEKLPASGISSRCVPFLFKPAGMGDLMFFLKDLLEKTGMWADTSKTGGKDPTEFWAPLIQTIATNASGSYRQATQLMEQCIHAEAFTIESLKDLTGMVDMNTWYETLHDVMDGKATDGVINNLLEGDYQNNFGLAYKVVADAEMYKVFNKILGQNAYFLNQAKALAAHPNFPLLRDTYKAISEHGGKYIAKSDYIIEISNLIEKCRAPRGVSSNLQHLQEQQPVRPVRGVKL